MVMLGVSTARFKSSLLGGSFVGYSSLGSCYSLRGLVTPPKSNKWSQGSHISKTGKFNARFSGDEILIELDCRRQVVTFWHNKKKQGSLDTRDCKLWPCAAALGEVSLTLLL